MATLHVRNVPDSLYERLRRQAETENRSLSAELVILLDRALAPSDDPIAVSERIRQRRAFDPAAVGAPDSTSILRVIRDGGGVAEDTYELALDDQLVAEARRIGQHPTDGDAVTAALEEYITHQRQRAVIDLFGTVDYEPDYDYKIQRRRS